MSSRPERPSIVYDLLFYAVLLLILAADPVADGIAAAITRIFQ